MHWVLGTHCWFLCWNRSSWRFKLLELAILWDIVMSINGSHVELQEASSGWGIAFELVWRLGSETKNTCPSLQVLQNLRLFKSISLRLWFLDFVFFPGDIAFSSKVIEEHDLIFRAGEVFGRRGGCFSWMNFFRRLWLIQSLKESKRPWLYTIDL